jgi:hypothetical protein
MAHELPCTCGYTGRRKGPSRCLQVLQGPRTPVYIHKTWPTNPLAHVDILVGVMRLEGVYKCYKAHEPSVHIDLPAAGPYMTVPAAGLRPGSISSLARMRCLV